MRRRRASWPVPSLPSDNTSSSVGKVVLYMVRIPTRKQGIILSVIKDKESVGKRRTNAADDDANVSKRKLGRHRWPLYRRYIFLFENRKGSAPILAHQDRRESVMPEQERVNKWGCECCAKLGYSERLDAKEHFVSLWCCQQAGEI
jgi:hypothetical protein